LSAISPASLVSGAATGYALGVRALAVKPFAAVLLTLCVGVHVLEVSGRWDRTLHDADDEAGVVAIVLCVGLAVAVARMLPKTSGLTLIRTAFMFALTPIAVLPMIAPLVLPTSAAGPPLPLRI
jgi:hypothetical protein